MTINTRRDGVKEWLAVILPALIYPAGKTLLEQGISCVFPGCPADLADAAVTILVALLLLAVAAWRHQPSNLCTGLTGRKIFTCIGTGIALAVCSVIISRMIGIPKNRNLSAPVAVSVCAAGPIAEEIVYRGYVQQAAQKKMSGWAGILLASAFFAAAHGLTVQALFSFFMGIALGYIAQQKKTVAASIIVHITVNTCTLIVNSVALY